MKDFYAKRNRVYTQYRKLLFNAINDAIDASLTGGKIDEQLGLFNQFHLLVQLRHEHYASARPLKEDIDCMSEKLFCKGVDTHIMEEIFPPSYDDETGEEWTPDDLDPNTPGGSKLDGIDFMNITLGDPRYPMNRIR